MAVPTAPAPRTTVVMARLSPQLRLSFVFWPVLLLAVAVSTRLAQLIPSSGFGDPHGFPFALDPAGHVAGDLTQDLVR